MKLKHLLAGAAVLAASTLLAACGGDGTGGGAEAIGDGGNVTENHSTRIHMLAAPAGRFTTVQNDDSGNVLGTLTLQNPYPSALWYSDRPERETGEMPLKDYVGTVWEAAYGQIDPNATLQFVPASGGGITGLYVSLSEPAYDEAANIVTFRAEVLNDTLGGPLPATLELSNATLNVLNNAEDDQEVASYVQHASQATLQPGTDAGQHVLVLSEASPDMFLVDNAPGRYSDSRPMSSFFTQWPYIFGDDPPNAALMGTTPTGGLRLYFLTLTDPSYDESIQELRYTATLLGGDNHGAMETLSQAVLLIDSGTFTRFPLPGKGTGYQAFSQGYDPSTANGSYLYFGSDIARKQLGSLWGTQSHLSQSCEPYCRNDLQTMKDMGINLIRLYDWDPRNDHSQFLDYAHSLGIKVVVPISNWLPTQGPDVWAQQLPDYFKPNNFGNRQGNDWHPAIAGVIISNELDQEYDGRYYGNVIGLIAQFIQEADKLGFSKSVPVGAPVTFAAHGTMPAWNAFDQLVNDPRLAAYKDRLMLCPNTYNQREYLFENAENRGSGWVQLTYERYGIPILFTEIGFTRANPDYTPAIVRDQLQGVIEYQKNHPDQLLGAMHFQFDNKVWKQTPNDTDSEGAFGAFRHGDIVKQIQTTEADYDYYVHEAGGNYGVLNIGRLEPTSTHGAVVEAYK